MDPSERNEPTPEPAPIYRPDQDLLDRPRLVPKPVGSRREGTTDRPAVKGGTLAGTPPQQRPEEGRPKRIVLPRRERVDLTFATHRPAPPEPQEGRAGQPVPERRVSTGFVLGLIVLLMALVCGLWMARLAARQAALERRIERIETAVPPPSAAVP